MPAPVLGFHVAARGQGPNVFVIDASPSQVASVF